MEVSVLRIAVFDDEKYSREELVHQILSELPDAEIIQGASGLEAIEIIEIHKFDILFVDIHLGDIQGTTIASLAKKLMPNAKIIFATAFSQYAVKAFELGVDNYILKPFDPKRVSEVLNLCCKSLPNPIEATKSVQKIAVRYNRHTVFINAEDIASIATSCSGRNCIIYTLNKKSYPTTPIPD